MEFNNFNTFDGRGGRPYGSFMDRQSDPISNMGAVMVSSSYDVGAKADIQIANREVGPSLYTGSENEQVWNVDPDDILFTVPGLQGNTGEVVMKVLPCLNGLGAVATARYAGEPNSMEMVRESVKNSILLVGAAYQYLSAGRGDVERGITVQMGGLKTLKMGNGKYGRDKPDSNVIKPGELLCGEVGVPGQEGLAPGPGQRTRNGVPANKYTIQLRRCNPESSSRSLQTHIHEILRKPTKWKVAMGEHLIGTSIWATAAHNVMNSYLTGGILFTRQLIASGLLSVSLAGQVLASGGVRAQLNNARGVADASAVELGNDNGVARDRTLGQAADQFSLILAELMGIIEGDTLTAGALNELAVDDPGGLGKRLKLLRTRALNSIFYDPSNCAFEFGFYEDDGNGFPSYAGRFKNTGIVNTGTPAGDFLLAQCNHFPRGLSGFHAAILRDLQFILGKAATGGSNQGSGNVHVFLGCCRQ